MKYCSVFVDILKALLTVNTMDFSSYWSGFGRKEVVEYLLQYGADVHAKDDGGFFMFVLFFNIIATPF